MESFKRYFNDQASCYTPPKWDLQVRSCWLHFTATLPLDNLHTIILGHKPTHPPDKHIVANRNTTDSHQNRHTTATHYSHTVADHMFSHRTHTTAAIITALCWADCNSLDRSSSCFLSTLDYIPSYFRLGSGCSNFVIGQILYSFTAGTDHPRFTIDFVLANSTGPIRTSFAAHYRFVIGFRCRVTADSAHSMSIANFSSRSALGLFRLTFTTTISTVDPIVAVQLRLLQHQLMDSLLVNCFMAAVL